MSQAETRRERDREIVRLRVEEHLTQIEIAKRYGLTDARIGQILNRHGIVTRRRSDLPLYQYQNFFRRIGKLAENLEKYKHGTEGRYRGAWIYDPCRCDLCREAHSKREKPARDRYQRKRRERERFKRRRELGWEYDPPPELVE